MALISTGGTQTETREALGQIQQLSSILTLEGAAASHLITTSNITKLNTALGTLLDYYQQQISLAVNPL